MCEVRAKLTAIVWELCDRGIDWRLGRIKVVAEKQKEVAAKGHNLIRLILICLPFIEQLFIQLWLMYNLSED